MGEIINLIETIKWPLLIVGIIIWTRNDLRLLLKELVRRVSDGTAFTSPILSMEERKNSEIGRDFLTLFDSSESIIIDSTVFLGINGKRFSESISPNMPVWVFIHKVRLQLEPFVQPYTYSQEWLLESKETGKIFLNIGVNRPNTKGDKFDARTVNEVGIYGCKELIVISAKKLNHSNTK